MEIEKKFTIKSLPENLNEYKCVNIIQGYLNRTPVVRVRRWDDEYILTYKNKISNDGLIINQEEEFPLNEEAFNHLLEKCDGKPIYKKRYIIPLDNKYINGYDKECKLKIELDVFQNHFEGLVFAEVEFPDEECASKFTAPEWFDKDVTADKRYSNGYLSTKISLDELDFC